MCVVLEVFKTVAQFCVCSNFKLCGFYDTDKNGKGKCSKIYVKV